MDSYSVSFRIKKRWVRTSLIVLVTALIVAPITAYASNRFTDVPNSNTFHDDITWLADADVTKGCNPPTNTLYCPTDEVTRGQMAAFLRRLAENQVVDAGELDGFNSTRFLTEVVTSAGSFIDDTDVDLATGETLKAASVQITAPAAGVLIIHNTSSWDLGTYVVHEWAELDTAPGCNPAYFAGDPLPGSFGTDAADSGVVGGEARANLAGIAAVAVPSGGTYTVHHCVQLFTGTSANNLDHSLTVQWLPTAAVDIAASPSVSTQEADAPEGATSKR
jgi:hypothetical protein